MREFNSQNIANTAWAYAILYATACHPATTLLDAILAEAVPRVREFNPQALANTAWAYATSGHSSPALLDAKCPGLANMAWAFAAAYRPTDFSGLFGQQFACRCEELAVELGNEGMSQLQQWRL